MKEIWTRIDTCDNGDFIFKYDGCEKICARNSGLGITLARCPRYKLQIRKDMTGMEEFCKDVDE